MNFKVTLIALTTLLAGSATAFAGGGKYVSYDKNPTVYSKNPAQSAELCYDAGFEFGIFAAGFFPDSDSHYQDAVGGGVSLGYFFNENLGLDLGAAVYGTSSEVHNYTLDVVYRFANQDDCYAPYVFVGGGVHTNSVVEALGRAGVGIDYKISAGTSIFADGSYNILSGDVEDYVTVRAGLRFDF